MTSVLEEEQAGAGHKALLRALKLVHSLAREEEHDYVPSSELIASSLIASLDLHKNFIQGIIERIRLQVPSTVSRSVFLLKFTYSHIVRPKVQFQPAL